MFTYCYALASVALLIYIVEGIVYTYLSQGFVFQMIKSGSKDRCALVCMGDFPELLLVLFMKVLSTNASSYSLQAF